MLSVKKILAPTDFSSPSEAGIRWADELARQYSAELHLIHVVTPTHMVSAGGRPVAPRAQSVTMLEEQEKWANKSMEEWGDEKISKEIELFRVIRRGNPADEIVSYAGEEAVDVIVIATHGWTGWKRFIFGSVAEKVIKMSGVPVLTIPTKTPDQGPRAEGTV